MESPKNDISAEVRELVISHVDSLGQLEVLMFLAADQDHAWTVRDVTKELRSNGIWVEANLKVLTSRGLLSTYEEEAVTKYRFSASTPELKVAVDKLLEEYPTFHLRISRLIYDEPDERLRRLADAFRFRRGDKNG